MVYLRSLKGMASLVVFVLLALIGCLRTWSQLVQWPVAQGGNGHFYEVVSAPTGITWGNASLAATNRGGYLATITSAEENAFVFSQATQDSTIWYSGYGPWLGGIQPAGSGEPAGGWRWITGDRSFTKIGRRASRTIIKMKIAFSSAGRQTDLRRGTISRKPTRISPEVSWSSMICIRTPSR